MNTKRQSVLIIGAGASGLMAAAMLAQKYDVTVLEARQRTGGRIFTIEDKFGFPAEAGAEFIHGEQPVTEKILGESSTRRLPFEGRFYRKEGGHISRDVDMLDEYWDELVGALNRLQEDQSIGGFIDTHFAGEKYRELRKSVKQFAEGYDAADLTKVSAFALREEWAHQDDDDQSRIRGGYQSLIRHLEQRLEAEGGEILLSTEVSQISWSAASVRVTSTDGQTFTGEKILITVPLGVLQQGRIAFSPELPDHRDAFSKLGFGGVIKFLFQFEPAFWEKTIQKKFPGFGFIFSDAAIPTWWSQAPADSPLITGWLGGPEAVSIQKDSNHLFDTAVESMCSLFDVSRETLTSAISTWHIADWVSDPFSCGAYAYATVGSKREIDFLLNPVEDTIYFAGEALYEGIAMGTVEAALRSGQRAANIITGQPESGSS